MMRGLGKIAVGAGGRMCRLVRVLGCGQIVAEAEENDP